MSIRPVDLQLMVQKSAEVHKLTKGDSGRPEIAQQQFADRLQKEARLNDQQVVETNKSEHPVVDKDGRNAGAGGKNAKKRGSDKKKKAGQKSKGNSMFDVSV